VVIVAEAAGSRSEPVAAALRTWAGDLLEVRATADGAAAVDAADEAVAAGRRVAIVAVDDDLPDRRGTDVLAELQTRDGLATASGLLVTPRASLPALDPALRAMAIHAMLTRPWEPTVLAGVAGALLARHLIERGAPEDDPAWALVPLADRARARLHAELSHPPDGRGTHGGHFLLGDELEPDEIETLLVRAVDRALGHPPRIVVEPGTVLVEEGEHVGGVYLVVDGRVALTHREGQREVLLHEASTGPVLGLLSLTQREPAFLTCRAVTRVRAIPLTLNQLGIAFDAEPAVATLFTQVLLSSLAARHRRADELQLEVDRLNRSLAEERDELSRALADLAAAQTRLIESARLSTLGELAAGIAHELNNPSAALGRAAAHLADDLDLALRGHVDDALLDAVAGARTARPRSTSEHRALRRALADALGDRQVADRALAAGVTDPDEARALLARDPGPGGLAERERFRRVGEDLRSVEAAATRVVELVRALRAHVREEQEDAEPTEVDVVGSIEDALRLLGHRIGDAEVHRAYAEVPPVTGHAGALQQVWTNLLANALDAVAEQPGPHTIEVAVRLDGGDVVVEVADDGPGIAPDHLERIFEPRFTTKGGRVAFGLGLGLVIAKGVVERHHGTISLRSEPGRTCAEVRLPAAPEGSTDG